MMPSLVAARLSATSSVANTLPCRVANSKYAAS